MEKQWWLIFAKTKKVYFVVSTLAVHTPAEALAKVLSWLEATGKAETKTWEDLTLADRHTVTPMTLYRGVLWGRNPEVE